MLRRKTGRYLLTLLVITGLAGTVNDNAVTKEERKYAISLMKDTKDDALKTVKGLSEDQLNFRESAERWSVKECLYHIAATEKGLWSQLEQILKAPANPEKRAEIKVTDEQLVKMIQDRSFKAKAPEPVQPKNTGYTSLEQAVTDFKNNRMAHIKYMKNSTEDFRNHVVQLPFGWIDAYQFYLFIAAHSNRHTQQINEVKSHPDFPQ